MTQKGSNSRAQHRRNLKSYQRKNNPWRRVSIDVDENAPRRARLINKALQRSARRWDLYGQVVKENEMPWEESKRTQEWRLVIQNGRLVRGLRKLEFVEERKDRLDRRNTHSEQMPEVWVHSDAQRSDTFGE